MAHFHATVQGVLGIDLLQITGTTIRERCITTAPE